MVTWTRFQRGTAPTLVVNALINRSFAGRPGNPNFVAQRLNAELMAEGRICQKMVVADRLSAC
jgi:hypothetical protein